ncbi:hypothetical protein BDR04DRAFT_1118776 [Suillus decipiens]|nr:hypothetical protein BDR04DRAFT_1118776 [Suillus decipiens]
MKHPVKIREPSMEENLSGGGDPQHISKDDSSAISQTLSVPGLPVKFVFGTVEEVLDPGSVTFAQDQDIKQEDEIIPPIEYLPSMHAIEREDSLSTSISSSNISNADLVYARDLVSLPEPMEEGLSLLTTVCLRQSQENVTKAPVIDSSLKNIDEGSMFIKNVSFGKTGGYFLRNRTIGSQKEEQAVERVLKKVESPLAPLMLTSSAADKMAIPFMPKDNEEHNSLTTNTLDASNALTFNHQMSIFSHSDGLFPESAFLVAPPNSISYVLNDDESIPSLMPLRPFVSKSDEPYLTKTHERQSKGVQIPSLIMEHHKEMLKGLFCLKVL